MKKTVFPIDFDFIPNEASLSKAAEKSFARLSFTFTEEHLEGLIKAALSPDASENDRYVSACMLKNALVASQGTFPLCQDTGIANVFGWKKGKFSTENLHEEITAGIKKIYDERKLRFSTTVPDSFYEEHDPKNNLPAQISIFDSEGSLAPLPSFVKDSPKDSLSFVFCAKGGGSSNKTSFIQGTKAFLNKERFSKLMKEELEHFGTSACPPYTIAIVAGGLSPEQNLLTLKLASMGAYDGMTYEANEYGFRDRELEELAMKIASESGYGAQFGGSQFALSAVVVRLPRHGASCPISFGVSCSAHRNLKAVLTKEGLYIEKTVANPAELKGFSEAVKFAEKNTGSGKADSEKQITSSGDIKSILSSLGNAKPGERILLSGKILVARDAAHARWQKLIDSGKALPEYCTKYPICYAGPARTPEGKVIGSFGPTTAGRMDVYAESLMSRGAALVTLAKGNRSKNWTDSCKKYGAFYLGTPGGIAALIASEYIKSQEILDYEDLGMEAVRLVEVENLPCFVITNKDGEDFYENLR
ncbi:fumarate hydrolyase [Treponema ruminis]|uniref:Fumarate hydratase class I n=1 Tax=Treponema ruminis TaxID=744515 RepID=A0A7W8G7T2_9SPIR|nr:FumA C-terminus/TtdB family hydratase beta subunit [Treponema ruminis]MBB5225314.1 fumarate hydratase class I [Treponema ruminis]QSI01815.1 fumarate hydrolyase [Treponema ruminis]